MLHGVVAHGGVDNKVLQLHAMLSELFDYKENVIDVSYIKNVFPCWFFLTGASANISYTTNPM